MNMRQTPKKGLEKLKKTVSALLAKLKERTIQIALLGIAALLIIGLGGFFIGSRRGAANQKKLDEQTYSARTTATAGRHTTLGTVTAINAQSITVKDSHGTLKTYLLDSKTFITDPKGTRTNYKVVKRNARVIVVGSAKNNQTLIAQRIILR
jgi:hypothetical protein